ncbi:MAG: diguanylate cyclase domain-containing protein [Acidobacteriota bacterium]
MSRRGLAVPPRPERRRTLRQKLLLTFAPFGVAVLLGLGVVQFALMVRRELAAATARLQAAAESIALVCENYLARHTSALTLLEQELRHEQAELDRNLLTRYLGLCRDANPGFKTMIVADATGRVIAASPATAVAGADVVAKGYNVADRPYFRDALTARGAIVSESFRGRGFGTDPILAISIGLRGPSGEPIGVIEGSLDLQRLHELIGPGQTILDRSVLIVDHGGRVVLTTDSRIPILGSVAAWRWQDGAGSSSGKLRPAGGAGPTFVAGTARTATGDWLVIVRRPQASVRRAVLRSEMWTWTALVGALAIFAFLVVRGSRRLAQPVRELQERLHEFSLEGRPEPLPTPADASSETASLITAFNGMAERLGAAHGELASTLDSLEARVRDRTAALAASERRYREFVEQTLGFVCQHDLEGKLLLVNPAAAHALGFEPADLVGRNLGELMTPFARERFPGYLATILRDGQADGLLELATRAGEVRTWHYHNMLVREPSQPPHVIGHAVDVTERRRAEMEAQRRALHDPLTGAGNRDLFDAQLQVALARAARGHQRVAVLYFDLDSFKEVNDRFGHAAGDRLLRSVADRLHAAVREADTVARLGGDEFGIVLADIGTAGNAARLAEKLAAVTAGAALAAELPHTVTASVGIAIYPEDGGTTAELLAAADAAMYRAKAQSRDRQAVAGEPKTPLST